MTLADGLAGRRLLVVEDNAINQEVVRGLLERFGAIVELSLIHISFETGGTTHP